MTKSVIRTKSTGEVFTPPALVDEIINEMQRQDPTLFTYKTKTFLDPACGDGEFLRGVIRKLKVTRPKFTNDDWKHTIEYQLLGTDLMWDNVCDTVYYLLRSWCDTEPSPTVTTITKPGMAVNGTSTPEEINEAFEGRIYDDERGRIVIFTLGGDNHHVEYSEDDGGHWTRVENIVRANALTEWDFINWQPKT